MIFAAYSSKSRGHPTLAKDWENLSKSPLRQADYRVTRGQSLGPNLLYRLVVKGYNKGSEDSSILSYTSGKEG